MKRNKYAYLVFAVSLVILCTSSFGLGALAAQKKIVKLPVKTTTAAVSSATATNTDTELFFKVWNTLQEKSVHFDEATDEDRMYGAVKGLTSSLGDPYTVFMTPKESKDFNESISGSFDGIGAEIGKKDDVLTIIAPLKNSPAERAGLKTGDKILKIDGVNATDMSIDEAIGKIRGKAGTVVKFDIYRAGDLDLQVVSVTRETIVIPTIDSEVINDVFVIHIYNFGEKVDSDFAKAITAYKNSGSKYMIIDLRGNPGGYLESAVDIGSYFIPKGKTIVTEDFVKKNKKDVHTSYGYNEITPTPKLVILIDAGSASASEILAGALHDNKIAKLVGVKSFGKGSVQELIPMKGNTSLKVTIARWLTPNGTAIDKEGIKPDVEVKRVYDAKNPKIDNQMDRAIEIVKK